MIGFIFSLYFASVVICTIGLLSEGDIYDDDREREEECKMKLITSYVPAANIILAIWYLWKMFRITVKAIIGTIKNLQWRNYD